MSEEIQENEESQEAAEMFSQAAEVVEAAAGLAEATVQPISFGPITPGGEDGGRSNLDLLLDVNIPLSVEVGRSQMSLDEILDLVPGSVVTLDKKAEEPVDLRVNGKLIARGEVVLVDDVYGIRITQIIDASGRIESLKRTE